MKEQKLKLEPPFKIEYDAEQLEAIKIGLTEWEELKKDNFFCTEISYRIVKRKNDTFVQFGEGGTAYKLFDYFELDDDKEGHVFQYLPVIVDGKMFAQWPDEGSGGILYLMICIKRRHKLIEAPTWHVTDLSLSWLHGEELDATDEQIHQNIIEDIERGENVFFPKPAGWV